MQHESVNNNLKLVMRMAAGAQGPHYFVQPARKEGKAAARGTHHVLTPILLVVQFVKYAVELDNSLN